MDAVNTSSELCASCKAAAEAGITDEDFVNVENLSDLSSDCESDEPTESEAHDESGDAQEATGRSEQPSSSEKKPKKLKDQPTAEKADALIADVYGLSEEEDSNGDEEGEADQQSRRRVRRSTKYKKYHRIKMPTGNTYVIPLPRPRIWKCGVASFLKKLRPYGYSRKEYYIVRNVMDRTKVKHNFYNFSEYVIITIHKVINGCLWARYLHRLRDIERETGRGKANECMLFHGSTHVDDIAQNGFNEQHSNHRGMFGAGLYFASHSSKANQYVFNAAKVGGCPLHQQIDCTVCIRKILLCRVAMGKTKIEHTMHRYSHAPEGYHSVTGEPSQERKGLKYPEYIVYRGEQIYPEYLITYKVK